MMSHLPSSPPANADAAILSHCLHIAVLEMFRFDAKLQPEGGSFQLVDARDACLVSLQQPGFGWIAVDVPCQMDGRLGAARGAVYPHRITDLIAWLSTGNVWILVRQNYPERG
uniref:Uncharacterized protein n=1 Tax=Anopheles farauti TaxID=69004 RepID=A0A182R066_9DIPT